MKVYYTVNGVCRDTKISNSDLLITTEKTNNRVVHKIKALKELSLVSSNEVVDYQVNEKDLFFINGYQSWTTTHEANYAFNEKNVHKFKVFKSLTLRPYGDYDFYKTRKGFLHSYDIFYVKGNNEIFILNNNIKNAFLIVELSKQKKELTLLSDIDGKKLKEGEEFVIFDYEQYDSYQEGMKAFNEKYPKRNIKKIFGYTSWYNYYQNINEEIMMRDLNALDERFDLFQIDDGYETFVGDWKDVDPVKFPHGLKPIVEKAHSKGLKAGLWLAPFVVEAKSKVFKEHPEYLKKDKNGKPIKVGVNWSGQYALDVDKEEVKEFIKDFLLHYVELGFDFFKLDFIYSSAYVHEGVTKAEASQSSYQFLKDVLKDKIILGCGATLSSVYQNFDYVRIGPDVSLDFQNTPLLRALHREIPSTKNTLKNTIYRSFMNNRWFGNDPDVFLLRDTKIKLSKEQKRALVTINALFGNVLMTSDDIGEYDEEKKELLQTSLNLFKNAKDQSFETRDDIIHISYTLEKAKHEFDYDTKKGIMKNER